MDFVEEMTKYLSKVKLHTVHSDRTELQKPGIVRKGPPSPAFADQI